ncbi:MAG: hypothetical protein ABR585_12360 [Gemmatimonadaceae bacterium]
MSFQLTDANFSRWEEAQSNLDALPRSAFRVASGTPAQGNAIDRAVARLQGSPRARRAIETSGISVRDFVLETVALAQATEAAQTGKSTSSAPVPPPNFQFVERYRSRILRAQTAMRTARRQMELDTQSESGATMEPEPQLESESAPAPPSEHATEPDSDARARRDSVSTRDSLRAVR